MSYSSIIKFYKQDIEKLRKTENETASHNYGLDENLDNKI